MQAVTTIGLDIAICRVDRAPAFPLISSAESPVRKHPSAKHAF